MTIVNPASNAYRRQQDLRKKPSEKKPTVEKKPTIEKHDKHKKHTIVGPFRPTGSVALSSHKKETVQNDNVFGDDDDDVFDGDNWHSEEVDSDSVLNEDNICDDCFDNCFDDDDDDWDDDYGDDYD